MKSLYRRKEKGGIKCFQNTQIALYVTCNVKMSFSSVKKKIALSKETKRFIQYICSTFWINQCNTKKTKAHIVCLVEKYQSAMIVY